MTRSPAGTELHDRIVLAARTSFVEHGTKVPMDDIARLAGVGVATLYRRFPDRAALLHSVAKDTIDRMIALTDAVPAEEPDAWTALTSVIRDCAELRLTLFADLPAAQYAKILSDPDLIARRASLFERLGELLAAAKEEGHVRGDVAVGDIAAIIAYFVRPIPGVPGDVGDSAARRMFDLVLDGLRARAPRSPLRGRPIELADIQPV
jgi:AcrR family transcriptional regulator